MPRAHPRNLLKHFHFDEQPLGNFEDTPMHWVRLAGDGLPRYNRGTFDHDIGHANDPPSFHLSLDYGNVGYEYRHVDLAIVPDSDYLIIGYIRPNQLRHARAFIAAFMVDRLGEPLVDSYRVSELVGSDTLSASAPTRAEHTPNATASRPILSDETAAVWHKVQIAYTGDYPTADALRLQLWILQSYVWSHDDAEGSDPVIRQDVRVGARFDDISIYRLPRARVRLSNPGGIVTAGRPASLDCELHNAADVPLSAVLVVTDVSSAVHLSHRTEVPPYETRREQVPLPPLPPGLYHARLRLVAGDSPPDEPTGSTGSRDAALVERQVRFAVLADLPGSSAVSTDLGVDLGPWRGGDLDGARELVRELGCGAIKVGVPLLDVPESAQTENVEKPPAAGSVAPPPSAAYTRYFASLAEFLRQLNASRIETTGVLLATSAAADLTSGTSTRLTVETSDPWRAGLGTALTHLAGVVSSWQLGDEVVELRDGAGWTSESIQQVRDRLAQSVTRPCLIVPAAAVHASARGEEALGAGDVPPADTRATRSLWLPGEVPARDLPQYLAFLAAPEPSADWLRLDPDRDPRLPRLRRLADLAHRVLIAKALGPPRLHVPAPFEQSSNGGGMAWEPTEDYIVLRTLFHYLAGKRAAGALTLGPDSVGLIFTGAGPDCVILWTWREEPGGVPAEAYLGATPTVVDLWGNRHPVEVVDGRARLTLAVLPIIVDTVHAPLALLQASFRLEPDYVQVYERSSKPVLSFHNPYRRPLAGTIALAVPPGWEIAPANVGFAVGPGESFTQTLDLSAAPRKIASRQTIHLRVDLKAPEPAHLEVAIPVAVGLREVVADAEARWIGDDLCVEQSLRNLSSDPLSFLGFCQPPDRGRIETVFLNVAPGAAERRRYLFASAPELAHVVLHLGIREIQGNRALDQLVEVPGR